MKKKSVRVDPPLFLAMTQTIPFAAVMRVSGGVAKRTNTVATKKLLMH
jgi:hypothetical protein